MGGGKGGTSTSTVTIPPEVLARYNAVNATAEDIGKTPFQAYSQDPSAFVAQTNAVQNSGINNIYNAQNSAQPWFQQAGNTYAQGAQGASPFNQMASSNINNALAAGVPLTMQGAMPVNAQQFSQQGVDQYMNPYMNDVIKGTLAPLQQQQQMDQSKLTGNAIGSGAFGGDRAGLAQAALMGQQQMATGNTVGNLLNSGYGQALNEFNNQQATNLGAAQANRSAAGQAGQQLFNQYTGAAGAQGNLGNQIFSQGVTGANTLAGLGSGAQNAAITGGQAALQAGTIPQQTMQAGLSALYNQFQQQQGYPFQVAQFLAGIAEGTGALSGSTTTTNSPTSAFSDERLKQDIEHIGETYDGQKIIRFRYKGENGPKRMGLIAQDVEKHHPEAVGQSHGYKTVDYDKATHYAAQKGHFQRGGLVPSSEGGVVNFNRAMEGFSHGGHYAIGGSPSIVDSTDLAALLGAHQNMYAGFNPKGLYGGAGLGGASPASVSQMPVPKLVTAQNVAPQNQGSLGSDLHAAVTAGKDVTSGYEMLKSGKEFFAGKDAKGDSPAEEGALSTAKKYLFGDDDRAYGGSVRHHRAPGGGLPYGLNQDESTGYMGTLNYQMPSPQELKNEQDSQRQGKMPSSAQGGLGNAAGTVSQLYNAQKLGSAGIDKAKDLFGIDKVGSAPMTSNGAAITDAAQVGPFMSEAPAGVGKAAAATTPVAETTAAATPIAETTAAATPIAEATAAAAPAAETVAAAAPLAEAGLAGGEALATTAAAGEGLADLLPLLAFAKRGGAVNAHYADGGEVEDPASELKYLMSLVGESNQLVKREHHDGNEGNVVGDGSSGLNFIPEETTDTGSDTNSTALTTSDTNPTALTTSDTKPTASTTKADVYSQLHPEFAPIMRRIIERANAEGIPVTPGSFVRSREEQAQIYEDKLAGRRGAYQNLPVARPGESLHDPSKRLAGDVNGLKPENYDQFGRIVREEGGEWGGDWKTPDWLHVQLPASKREGLAAYTPDQQGPATAQDAFKGVKSGASDTGSSKSKDWTDTLTSEKFLVPLFSGLAGMASSPSRYFGSAILQGLGAGAQSYQQMKAQESVIAKREADIQREKEQSQIGFGTLGVQQQTAQTARISKVAEIMQQLRTLNAGREIAGLPALDTAEFFKSIGAGDLLKDAPLPADAGAGKTAGTTTQQPAGGTQTSAGQPTQQPSAAGSATGTSTDKPKQLETTVEKASEGMPKPTDDFWKGVDPNDNLPLLQKNFKIAMSAGLTPLAEKIANDINRIKTSGSVMKDGVVVGIPGQAETEAARKAMVTKAEKETAEPFETKKMSTEKNYATQNAARSKAAVEADNANDLLSQTSAMKSLLFDKNGNALVNTGPLGEKINRYAGMFKQAGFSDNFIKQLMNTDPNNADAVKKLQTSTGTELARMELNGAPVRVGEFNQYVQNATPGAQMLPGAIKWIIDNAIEPKAKAQQAVYERVMDMDPAKDNIEKEIYLARKENPWHHYTPEKSEAGKPPPAPDVAAAELARRRAAKGTQ